MLRGEPDGSLTLSGVVDIFDAAALHAAALEVAAAGGREVRVDLGRIEAVDTAATQILLALKRDMAFRGGVLRLLGCPPSIGQFWRDAGLGELVHS